jgi:hypothetical protein
MGIPKLNKWLLENCSPHSIEKKHLSVFQDKRIAVDISIYLYRFLIDGRFMENLYLFLAILRYYCIRPIFIFDGKAPAEKRETIKKRNKEKQDANTQYAILEKQFADSQNENEKRELQYKMAALKKKMVRVTWAQIDAAIELIVAFGFEYYLAPHEADQLCVHLAVTKEVCAILSDDMDLLISGVPYILRNLNMTTHESTLYDTHAILVDIKMTLTDFRETIVLSGTDYTLKEQPVFTIKKCFDFYKEYKLQQSASSSTLSFYEWLGQKGIIEPNEYKRVCMLFDTIHCSQELTEFIDTNRKKRPRLSLTNIQNIMRQHKFIFSGGETPSTSTLFSATLIP